LQVQKGVDGREGKTNSKEKKKEYVVGLEW
jgi:hypothetical protein